MQKKAMQVLLCDLHPAVVLANILKLAEKISAVCHGSPILLAGLSGK